MENTQSDALVFLGATGDLAYKKIFPALKTQREIFGWAAMEGTLWVATSKGIDSFRNLPVVTLSKREGLHLDDAQSIPSSKDGTIWIGNDGALDAWRKEGITSIQPKDGLPGRQVTSMLQVPTGGLWVGIGSGLFHFEHRKFVPVIQPGGPNIVLTMTAGPDDSLWAGVSGATSATVTHLESGHLYVRQKFVPGDALLALATDPQGRIWLAGDKLRYLGNSGVTAISEFGPRFGYIRNIAVLTVDDHPLLREGIATLVNAEADMKIVAEASTGEQAIELFRKFRPE